MKLFIALKTFINMLVYIKNVDRLTEELKGGLSVGEEYCLFTRYSVDTKIRTSLKSLKTALHKSFGDNGTDYYVLLREVDGSDNDDNFEPKSPYGLQKLITEKYCKLFSKLYNLDTVSIRPFNIYGPNQLGNSAYSTVVSSWLGFR
jgi:hypothetical protein